LVGAEQIREIPVWVGRESLLDNLVRALLVARRKVILLTGQAGIGKTSLAVKLLERVGVDTHAAQLQPDCPFVEVVYVRVQPELGFDGIVQELADGLSLGDLQGLDCQDAVKTVVKALQQRRSLLILDDLENVLKDGWAIAPEWGHLLQALATRVHQSQVLVTSREMVSYWTDLGQVHTVKVTGISQPESIELMRQQGLKDTQEDLAWIGARVDGHVQVLDWLVGIAQQEYPGYLREHPTLLPQKAAVLVSQQLNRQNEAAQSLLRKMCVLRIGLDVKGLTFLRLYQHGLKTDMRFLWIPWAQSTLKFRDTEIAETHKILEALVQSNLLEFQIHEHRKAKTYRLHNVIAEVLRFEAGPALLDLSRNAYWLYRLMSVRIRSPQSLEDLQPLIETQHFAIQLGNYGEAENLIYQLETYLRLWGHWKLLKELYEQIVEHLPPNSQPYIWSRLGSCYRAWGDWQTAEEYFQQALTLAQSQHNLSLIAAATGQLGDIERNRGNWDAAERLYRQCLGIETHLGDRAGMATSWGQLGDIERNRERWDAAIQLYRQSLALRTDLEDQAGMAESWGMLGHIECKRGYWDAAEQLLRQSLALRTKLGDRPGIAMIWGCLGETEMGRGNFDPAAAFFKEALAQQQTLQMTWHVANTHTHLMQLEQRRNNPDQSHYHYTTAHALFSQLGAQKDLERLQQLRQQNQGGE
jgi:tetratricopeptide (TPR) repeat protein